MLVEDMNHFASSVYQEALMKTSFSFANGQTVTALRKAGGFVFDCHRQDSTTVTWLQLHYREEKSQKVQNCGMVTRVYEKARTVILGKELHDEPFLHNL